MRFLVLGAPVVVDGRGERVPIGSVEQQALFVALVLNANHTVTAARLIDAIWPRHPGPARADLRVVANGLHEVLRSVDRAIAARLVRVGGGYQLRLDPEEADCLQFGNLLRQGDAALAAGDLYAAAHLFTEAMSLWRGSAATGVPVYGWLRGQLDGLEELRTDTTARVVEAYRALEHADLGPVVPAGVRAEPGRNLRHRPAGRPRSMGSRPVTSRTGR